MVNGQKILGWANPRKMDKEYNKFNSCYINKSLK